MRRIKLLGWQQLALAIRSSSIRFLWLPRRTGTLLSSSAVATQTAISILLSLIAVVAFAVLLQVILVTRGGLTALEGINGLFPPAPGVHAQSPLIFNH